MGDSPLILGVSGLRGIVGESLTPELAVRYAATVGTWLQDQFEDRRPHVLVARDGRIGGESTYTAAISGLLAVGCRVKRLGVAMTPTVGMQCDYVGADAALIITASHNPQEWNGIKILINRAAWVHQDRDGREIKNVVSDACAPDAATAQEILDRYAQGKIDWWCGDEIKDSTIENDVEDPHCLRVLTACEPLIGAAEESYWDTFETMRKLSVVMDSVNCSGSYISELFYEDTPCRMINLHGEQSGRFPHTPEPTKENLSGEGGLCDVVPGIKADVGFAQDPDADRLAIVDERGEYIGEEYTLVLCAMALMEARMGDDEREGNGKPEFVVNLSTSRMIDDVAAHYGGEVVRSAVGEANVVEVMKSLKAQGRDVVLGGEGNGGVIWAEVTYVRDSLSGMALVLSLMARTGKSVSELVSMINEMGPTDEVREQGYTILKAKSDLASKSDAVPVVKHLEGVYSKAGGCRVDLQDGIRIDWDERGVWAHVRASNTEPIMRVIVEAPSKAEAERVAAEIDGHILGA
ncbi:MAG: phosphoglucosamine mutase [Phycisphaerales bacterium]